LESATPVVAAAWMPPTFRLSTVRMKVTKAAEASIAPTAVNR
jgi:hypothetical protein